MRYKKIIAIALCVGLISTCFNGIITSYAKNDNKDAASGEAIADNVMQTSKAPDPYITNLEPEVNYQNNNQSIDMSAGTLPVDQMQNNGTSDIGIDEGVIAEGMDTGAIITDNMPSSDIYNFGAEDIDRLLQEGYSIMDIIDADEIGNQLGINPTDLLKIKKDSKKDLKEIREDILKERKEKANEYLKNKYPDAYKKLKDKNLSDDEISCFFGEMEVNEMQPSDDLITGYVEQGDNVFLNQIDSKADEDKSFKDNKDNNDKTLSDEIISEGRTQDEEADN